MKNFALAFSALFALAGCTSSSGPSLVANRVGPSPTVLPSQPGDGLLLVRPDWLPLTSLDDPDMSIRATYKILSDDGAIFRDVRVWAPEHQPEPTPIRLPAGLYTVEARASGYGRVGVPVKIEKERTTIVRLDGEADSSFEGSAASQLVALPDGSIIGWRAAEP
jgi:hypothetical protein